MNPTLFLNNLGQGLVSNLGPLSLELALWTAVVLLILTVLRVHSPALRHLAWVLVLLKPLTTLLLQSPVSLYSLLSSFAEKPLPAPGMVLPAGQTTSGAPSGSVAAFTAAPSLGGYGVPAFLWISIAAVLLLRLIAGQVFLARLLRRASRVNDGPLHQLLQEAAAGLRVRRSVQLALTEQGGPLVAGIFRPLVILPRHLAESLSPDQLRLIFAHELAHVRRWDNLVLLGQQLVEALLFFHPSAWLCRRGLRLEAEKACDDAVLRQFPDPTRYADSLARVAEFCSTPKLNLLINTVAAAESSLGWRIRRILEAQPMPRSRVLTTAAVLVLIIAGCFGLPEFTDQPKKQSGRQEMPRRAKEYTPLPYYFEGKGTRKIMCDRPADPLHPVLVSLRLGLVDEAGEKTADNLAGDVTLPGKLEPYMGRIRGVIYTTLGSKTQDQLRDVEALASVEDEIAEALNRDVFSEVFKSTDTDNSTGVIRVAQVLFSELVIE